MTTTQRPLLVDLPTAASGRPTLRAGTGWLRALGWLRLHGVEHEGFPSFVGRAPLLRNEGTMRLGAHVSMRGQQIRPSLATGPSGRLLIGDRSFINQGVTLHAALDIEIGQRVLVGDFTSICDTNFHEVDPGEGVRTAPIVIGDDVWLARGVIVLPGVTIGEGTVVAAGSVVRGE